MNKKENNNSINVIVLVVAVLLSFISGTVGSYLVITNVPSISKSIVENVTKLDYTENSIAGSVEKVKDSVVVVVSYSGGSKIATGTGFVYKIKDNKAYIMTNNHVIADADSVKLITDSGEMIDASIKGGETYADIAVLMTDKDKVGSPIEIGDSSKIRIGDTVFTIGSPLGESYSGTVTKGILSGKDRLVETTDYYMKVLQTDAAINPGNSGGPLLNINGEVIGINSLKLVKEEVEGMGFAIPIEDAVNYAEIIEVGNAIERPYVGISMLDITDQYYLWKNGIDIPENISEGVAILSVEPDSPAAKAGLQKGDIIVKLGDAKIDSLAKFRYELYKLSPNDTVDITVNRDGATKNLKITLGRTK